MGASKSKAVTSKGDEVLRGLHSDENRHIRNGFDEWLPGDLISLAMPETLRFSRDELRTKRLELEGFMVHRTSSEIRRPEHSGLLMRQCQGR